MKTIYQVIALVTLLTATATARPRPSEGERKRFESNKTFGLGVELGEPSGINGKYFYATDRAIDFGVGDIYDYYSYRGVYAYVDHLWHPVSLASTDSFELPFFVGVGGAIWHWEDYRNYPLYYNGNSLGARVPFGISFDFNNTPLDIYLQIVPTLHAFVDRPMYYDRSLYFFIDGSLGVRYWFK
jgi:hypothetical protein